MLHPFTKDAVPRAEESLRGLKLSEDDNGNSQRPALLEETFVEDFFELL